MQRRSLISRIFGSEKEDKTPQTATEIKIFDNSKAIFTRYNGDFFNDADVRACVDTIARNGAKMHAKHIRKNTKGYEILEDSLYRLLSRRPNELQNAYRFYYHVISELEMFNNSFIYVQKDENLKVTGLYPLNFNSVKLYEYKQEIYLEFQFGYSKKRFVPLSSCIHLTRFVSENGLFGGTTTPIVKTLSMKHVLDEGIINAIKTTQSIKGVIKSTQAMLKPEDVKKMRDQFVKDFVENADDSGIGGLDASTDFTPVKIEPTTASDGQIKSIDNKILNYFGINENIIQSKYSEDEWNAFYESVLEPIGLQMAQEFTNKLFTPTELYHGNEIVFESNRLQYASNTTKINLLRYGNNVLMVDEQREILNLAPLPNGEGQKVLIDQNHTQNINDSGNNSIKPGKEDETNEEGN